MPYTPELDDSACTTLRRLSWAIAEPMTKTMKEVFKFLPLLMDSGKVCEECEDKSKCDQCYFNLKNQEDLKSELFTDIVQKENLQEKFCSSRLTERTKPKRKKKSPALCKSCKDKIEKQKKRQNNKQQEESKEWNPEDGPFFEE